MLATILLWHLGTTLILVGLLVLTCVVRWVVDGLQRTGSSRCPDPASAPPRAAVQATSSPARVRPQIKDAAARG